MEFADVGGMGVCYCGGIAAEGVDCGEVGCEEGRMLVVGGGDVGVEGGGEGGGLCSSKGEVENVACWQGHRR